jgi:hypothetical protein
VLAGVALLGSREVWADDVDGQYAGSTRATEGGTGRPERETPLSTRDGAFLPYTQTARIGHHHVSSFTLGGYDSSVGQGPLLSSFVDGALFSRLALRAGLTYLNLNLGGGKSGGKSAGTISPSAGVRFVILRQETHDLDLGMAVTYLNRGLPQPRGEPDGEIQLAVLLGRRFDLLGLFGNVIYHQGLDAEERNAELCVAGLLSLSQGLHVGLDVKARYELTAAREREVENIVSDWDIVAGPLGSYAWRDIMVTVQAGTHVEQLRVAHRLSAGAVVIAGVGATF